MIQRFHGFTRPRFIRAVLRLIAGLVVLASLPNAAVSVEDQMGGNLRIRHVFAIGVPDSRPSAEVADYSNITNFSGQVFVNGGAALLGPNTITRVVADDLQPAGLAAGQDVTRINFSVANASGIFVVCRARVRLWYEEGSGVPGAFYDNPMPIGITFNPLTFPPGVSIVEAVFAPGLFKMPTGTFWAGLTFDNADGTTTADETTLNLMGQGIFTPPNTGASSPAAFITDFPGSYFNVGHPSGHRFDFPDGPPANFGWEFYAISSTPTVSSTWGRIKNIYR